MTEEQGFQGITPIVIKWFEDKGIPELLDEVRVYVLWDSFTKDHSRVQDYDYCNFIISGDIENICEMLWAKWSGDTTRMLSALGTWLKTRGYTLKI